MSWMNLWAVILWWKISQQKQGRSIQKSLENRPPPTHVRTHTHTHTSWEFNKERPAPHTAAVKPWDHPLPLQNAAALKRHTWSIYNNNLKKEIITLHYHSRHSLPSNVLPMLWVHNNGSRVAHLSFNERLAGLWSLFQPGNTDSLLWSIICPVEITSHPVHCYSFYRVNPWDKQKKPMWKRN